MHIDYHTEIFRALNGRLKQVHSLCKFLKISDFNIILQEIAVSLDDKDSVCWYAARIIKNYRKGLDLPNFSYLMKRIAEIPKEHRPIILRENSSDSGFNCTETWLCIISQANESKYYATLMYKFIPFLDEKSFWSIFIHYSYNWLSRYPCSNTSCAMPAVERLNSAFELLQERIKTARFLPRSPEASEALRWYLSPWFPVSLVYKMRLCSVLEPCW